MAGEAAKTCYRRQAGKKGPQRSSISTPFLNPVGLITIPERLAILSD
jgi:hypothetical protein